MIEITNIEDIKGIKGLSPEEQECQININPNTGEAEIYCSSNKYLTKLKKMLIKDANYKCYLNSTINGNATSYIFKCPAKGISFKCSSKKSSLTKEQKIAKAERMRNNREKKEK